MAGRIQLRRGTAANWTSANPVLAAGEVGVETDTGRAKVGDGVTAWTSLAYVDGKSIPISGSASNAAAVVTQATYALNITDKGGNAALRLVAATPTAANKAPLQVYSPKTSPQGEDVLATFDFAGNGFPGPITVIKANGGIETGAFLIVSGHAQNTGSSAGYKQATYKRTMATVWTDTPGATSTESNAVLSLRNVGAAYPAGDAGNCDILLIVEDVGDSVIANGIERLSIRPKGDIYQLHTDHTVDWFNATNYERAHLGWDRANSRYVVETQAGGTGTRRELLVKDRKHVMASYAGSLSAAGATTFANWVAPRACVIKAVKFACLTNFAVNGTNFWRAGALKYTGGALAGSIVAKGSDSVAITASSSYDLGTPDATHSVLAAGDMVRIYAEKFAAPAAIDSPTVTIEWEPV